MDKLSDITFVFDEETHKDITLPLMHTNHYRIITDEFIHKDINSKRIVKYDVRLLDYIDTCSNIERYKKIYEKTILRSYNSMMPTKRCNIEVLYDNYSGLRVQLIYGRKTTISMLFIPKCFIYGSIYLALYDIVTYLNNLDIIGEVTHDTPLNRPMILEDIRDRMNKILYKHSSIYN